MEKIDLLMRFPQGSTTKELSLASVYIVVAEVINEMETDSREKTIAIEKLEESYMWAKKGIVNDAIE